MSCFLQLQAEREQAVCDMDLLQAQVDKTLGQSTRMQRDKEAVESELNKLKDKYDKAQVSDGSSSAQLPRGVVSRKVTGITS